MMRHGRFALLALWLIAVAVPAWGAPPLQSVLPNGLRGTDNAFTSQDYTAYFETLAGDQVDLALELEADRMTGLAVSDDEFALERDVVKEERRQRTEDDPHGALTHPP